MDPIEGLAIVLSLVALIVTVIGFFASLRFYRDGMNLSAQANQVLAKIEEKAGAIQTQVGGIFAKTLDAALGQGSAAVGAQSQQLAAGVSQPPASAAPHMPHGSLPPTSAFVQNAEAGAEPAVTVLRYFQFKKMRFSNVSQDPARAIFNLGICGGFNLFDGVPGVTFFGYFSELESPDIVGRVRLLLANLELAYKNVTEAPPLPLREQALRLLDQVVVEIVVPENVNKQKVLEKIQEYQPASRTIHVAVHKPSDISTAVAQEFERMKV